MRTIEVKQLHCDLTTVAGLALVGHHLKTLAPVLARLDAELPVRGGVSNSDIVRSYLGLLVQGKSDFDAIENHRQEKFYKQALGISLLPSSPTLRQRMDAQTGALSPARAADDRDAAGAPGTALRCAALRVVAGGHRHQRPRTTAAPPRKAWAAPTPAWTGTARWRRTSARTASA